MKYVLTNTKNAAKELQRFIDRYYAKEKETRVLIADFGFGRGGVTESSAEEDDKA